MKSPSSSRLLPSESPGPPQRGALRMSALAYVAWVVCLVALVALCTLAPSVIVLQSMQRHVADLVAGALGSSSAFTGVSPVAMLEVQHSRRMQVVALGTSTLGRNQTAAAPAAAETAVAASKVVTTDKKAVSDCQKAQLQQQQRPADPPSIPPAQQQAGLLRGTQAGQQQQQQQHMAAAAEQQQQQQHTTAPTQQEQQQQQLDPLHGLPSSLVQQLGPVDIVYLWVNGSDPILQQELQDFATKTTTTSTATSSSSSSGRSNAASAVGPTASVVEAGDDPLRQSRFDAGRDELRYSLRSLEMYMPWFRNVYIVTNGQVPTWLDPHHPRVKVVPHSSIFERPQDLPTFSSAAIQVNVANIPGLSDTFIMLDDDFFLTAPWTLSDFVGPDGGLILTGSTPVSTIQSKENIYLQMTKSTNWLFAQKFGAFPRHDPAHAPRLFQQRYLQELQRKTPDAFRQTSASKARSASDIIVPSAYMWYLAQFEAGEHPYAPEARTTFVSVNDLLARRFVDAAGQDFANRLADNDEAARDYAEDHAGTSEVRSSVTPAVQKVAMGYEVRQGLIGPYSAQQARRELYRMIRAWSQPGTKVVCLNDDMSETFAYARPIVNDLIRDFLGSRYPKESQFEVPHHRTNGCNGRLRKTAFGELPHMMDFITMCHPPPTGAYSAHGRDVSHGAEQEIQAMPPPRFEPMTSATSVQTADSVRQPQDDSATPAAAAPTGPARTTAAGAAAGLSSDQGNMGGNAPHPKAQPTLAGLIRPGELVIGGLAAV